MIDPNKAIFQIDPSTRSPEYWNGHHDEISKILASKTFDADHGRSSNLRSQSEFWHYTMDHADADNGLWLEFGVYQGRSINEIAKRTSQTVYGFDSFEGLPEDWYSDIDFCKKGSLDLDGILPSVASNVHLIAGWFEDTLPKFVDSLSKDVFKISFMHIDCDLYSSTKTIFDTIGHLVVPGTVIMFDEYWYNYKWDEHEFKAFQEFTERTGLTYEYIANTHRGLASLIIKETT